jgi:hypothetical protein
LLGFMPYILAWSVRHVSGAARAPNAAQRASDRRPARSWYQAPPIRTLPTSLSAPYAARPRADVRAARIPQKSFARRKIILDVGAEIAIIALMHCRIEAGLRAPSRKGEGA